MKELDMKDRIINFNMEGNAFDNGFDLHNTLNALQNLQSILDKAYLTLVDKERMTKKDRELFKIKVTSIKKGSFLSELMIYSAGAIQVAYPIINAYSPSLLLDVFKEGYIYLTNILQAKVDGKEVYVEQKESGDSVVLVIKGDVRAPIVIGAKTYDFVRRAYDDVKNLVSQVDGEEVKNIQITDRDYENYNISITEKEKELFDIEPRLEEIPVHFKGEIFRIDTHARNGKLIIHDCDEKELIGMELNFEITLDKHVKECSKIIDQKAEFVAFKKIEYDPITLKEEIKSLKIIDIT